MIGASCYREGRIDPYQRIRYRAGQIRRVDRAVVLQCDDIVHWIANLAQFIASLQQVVRLVGTDRFPNSLYLDIHS